MRLYIGKNHDERDATVPVQSIFRLVGRDEDALTYALGFLLARDPVLCADLVRLCGVKPTRSFKNDYAVRLQEVTDPGYGRRDIVIETGKIRIVIEAKIGSAEPTAKQLLKYANDPTKWDKCGTGVVASLTQGELSQATRDQVVAKLDPIGITLATIQWHQVIDVVLRHTRSDGSEAQYLFDEFINYVRSDYNMGYYDVEVLIQVVNPCNAQIFEEGWMYVTSPKDKEAPLYFAPYFTRRGSNSGISQISRVANTRTAILSNYEDINATGTNEQLERWHEGLKMIRKRAEKEDFLHSPVRLFFLDQPIQLRSTPLNKKAFNETKPSKRMPPMIPKGFSLRFDELLPHLT